MIAQSLIEPRRCGTTEYYFALKKDSIIKKQLDENERRLLKPKRLEQQQAYNNNTYAASRTIEKPDTIAIVFHLVLPKNILPLITDAVIQKQIEILNRDYDNANFDRNNTPDFFKPLRKATAIKFAIALNKPDDEDGVGIIKTESNFTFQLDNFNDVKQNISGGSNAWNTSKYLNIWVTQLQNLLGISVFPYDNTKENLKGIVIDYRAFGDNTVANYLYPNYASGRTLTHEIGHFFGLKHIWGDDPDCDADDNIDDTPKQKMEHINCPTFPEKDELCNTSDVSTMFMNFMDYTHDACMNMFSKNQVDVMETILYDANVYTILRTSKNYQTFLKYNNDIQAKEIIDQNINDCNPIKPIVKVRNKGKQNLQRFDIDVYQNNKLVFTEEWRGNIAPRDTLNISLHAKISQYNEELKIIFKNPNGLQDDDSRNNELLQNTITCPYKSNEDYFVSYVHYSKQVLIRHSNENPELEQIIIMDAYGNPVRQVVLDANANQAMQFINVQNLPADNYFVTLKYKNNVVTTMILIY